MPNILKWKDKIITDRKSMLDFLNQHFLSSGSLFEHATKTEKTKGQLFCLGEM